MKCKCGCGKEVPEAVGKKPRLFYSDACRKRYKRTQETDTATNGQEETDTDSNVLIAEMVDDTYVLPPLPADPVLACNQDITWADVLAMSREQIDYVYKAWRVIGDNLLLRLKRAAGYHNRVAA